MYQLLSLMLEALGRVRVPIGNRTMSLPRFGSQVAPDALGGFAWRDFTSAEALFDVWGSPIESPWYPYHTVTLFSALATYPTEAIGVLNDEERQRLAPFDYNAPAASWLTKDSMIVLDLPGPLSVAVATSLIVRHHAVPVVTFDNWPQQRALLTPELNLAALLFFVPLVAKVRRELPLTGPPVWILDRHRLSRTPGSPGQFDNRYFLDESNFPGPDILIKNGLRSVIYVRDIESDTIIPDLHSFIHLAAKQGISFFTLSLTELTSPGVHSPTPLALPPPNADWGFGCLRSSAGGFGSFVPQPSSG